MRMASGSSESFTVPGGYFDDQQLVAAHASEIVHVAGLGHADDRMNQTGWLPPAWRRGR